MSRVLNRDRCHNDIIDNRYLPIDIFRGCAILGMIFFTVTLRLSDTLPDVLRHNAWGAVHLGDFILPFFLFASGLSLAFYVEKNHHLERIVLIKTVGMRFAFLASIGLALSFFSANGLFAMDEVMLSALLFLGCVVLYRVHWMVNVVIIFVINCSYLVLMSYDLTSIFIGHYLGGYPAALYYFPIMLTGVLIGQGVVMDQLWSNRTLAIIGSIGGYFLIFSLGIPLNKLEAAPSFMMLAILFSCLVFFGLVLLDLPARSVRGLARIGRTPLRYWVLMYVLVLIPLSLYIRSAALSFPLSLSWGWAVGISLVVMGVLYLSSSVFEYIAISK